MAKQLDITDALKKIDAQIGDLENKIKLESDEIARYEMGSGSEYDSGRDPSEDNALRRALMEQAFDLGQVAPSNVLAQLSMIRDPNFAPVFKDATRSRVNAARQYFADLGTISRDAQSQRAARAKSTKRSDARLRGYMKQLADLRKRRGEVEDMPLDVAGKQAVRRTPTFANVSDVRQQRVYDIPQRINKLQNDNAQILTRLNPDMRDRIMAGTDPSGLLGQASAEDKALLNIISQNRAEINRLGKARRQLGDVPLESQYSDWTRKNVLQPGTGGTGRGSKKGRSRRANDVGR